MVCYGLPYKIKNYTRKPTKSASSIRRISLAISLWKREKNEENAVMS
jgi:hypothetical protein